jgi:ABC-type uncharacterized transport system substrate-binding protein
MRLKTVRLVVMVALVILTAPLDVHMLGPSAGKVYRIGFLRQGHPHKTHVEAFQQGFRERGYVEGQNVVVEYRFDGSLEQLPHLAAELVRLQVDVLLVPNMPAALAAKHATSTIPIVMVGIRAGAGGQPTHRKSLCLGVQLHLLEARGPDAFDSAFAVMTSAHAASGALRHRE